MKPPKYLFVYGSLRSEFNNPYSNFLKEKGRWVSKGIFKGVLLNLGNYPAVKEWKNGRVVGEVYDISENKRIILDFLDAYEGINVPNPEYSREIAEINTQKGYLPCYIYKYSGTDDFKVIDNEDYIKYLKK